MTRSAPPPLPRPHAIAAALAVAGLIVAASVALITVDDSTPAGASLSGRHPATVGKLRLQHLADTGFEVAVLDHAHPETVHVMVPHGNGTGQCSVIHPVATVRAQSSRSVTVAVSGYEYLPRASANGDVEFACIVEGRASVPVHLDAPLGKRTLRSGAHLLYSGSDPAATVLDPADLPTPRYLPAGYRSGGADPIDAAKDRMVGERRYAKGTAQLVVSAGSSDDLIRSGLTTGHVTIAGQRGAVIRDPGQQCVSWSAGAGRARMVCSYAKVPLSQTTLTRIARSLH